MLSVLLIEEEQQKRGKKQLLGEGVVAANPVDSADASPSRCGSFTCENSIKKTYSIRFTGTVFHL